MNSLLAFRSPAAEWTTRSETAFTAARALPFTYATPKEG
jgi:hypothetical protein